MTAHASVEIDTTRLAISAAVAISEAACGLMAKQKAVDVPYLRAIADDHDGCVDNRSRTAADTSAQATSTPGEVMPEMPEFLDRQHEVPPTQSIGAVP
jgi:hypothetical protein